MHRLISFAAAPLLAIALLSVSANADPIKDRQAIMKDQGKTVGSITPIIKGEKPFDAAAVIAALKHLNEDAQMIDAAKLFPAGSDKGAETTASPKIWEDNAGFVAALAKYKKDAAEVAAAEPKDLESFKVAFNQVTENCAACHKAFRIKKD
ncbi:cytochrome C556 [Phyllobacterium brassicacearum]|uniref:Cytochrome C556 n=1 Tax=Phyllobacterium brassicacearum TaxID=314235 RepID=A0A2P7BVW1_9HYPH|nr:cytochrome c [Phyllobacterium brassicacearum]PSH70583.1 cytochrome C556 [Phyllobacterium brassicacearum]TDQ35960.1 cytochrome c556 [Phyllobacterium brassicacearum]